MGQATVQKMPFYTKVVRSSVGDRPYGLGQETITCTAWIDKRDLLDQVDALAKEIREKECLTLMYIMRGGLYFGQILGRKIHTRNPGNDFIECPIIAKRTEGNELGEGPVRLFCDHIEWDKDVHGRNVVIIDDILDSGETIRSVQNLVREKGALTITTAVALRKTGTSTGATADYALFEIPCGPGEPGENVWFAGFGMDWNRKFRCLEDIISIPRPSSILSADSTG